MENINPNSLMVIVPQVLLDELIQDVKAVKEICQDHFKSNENSSEWLTSEEARKVLAVSAKTWQQYRDKRIIPFSQFGRKIYVRRTDLDDFMRNHEIRARG